MTIRTNYSNGEKRLAADLNEENAQILANASALFAPITAGEGISGGTTPKAVALVGSSVLNMNAEDATKQAFVGFATDTKVAGQSANIQTIGVVSGFTGLTVGADYFAGVNHFHEISFPVTTTSVSAWDLVGSTTYQNAGQEYRAERDGVITKVGFPLKKVGSPTDSIICRIYASDKTTLLATSTNSILGSSLTTSVVRQEFSFSPFVVVKGTSYFILFSRTGSLDNTNLYGTQYSAVDYYPVSVGQYWNGSSWNGIGDFFFSVSDGTANSLARNTPYDMSVSLQFGLLSGQLKSGQTFTATASGSVTAISAMLKKNASPTDSVICKIYASDKTTLLGTSTNSISNTDILAYAHEQMFFFDPIAITNGTTYFIEFLRTGAGHATNNYTVQCSTAGYAGGGLFYWNGSAWVNTGITTYDAYFIVHATDPATAGGITTINPHGTTRVGRAITPEKILINKTF